MNAEYTPLSQVLMIGFLLFTQVPASGQDVLEVLQRNDQVSIFFEAVQRSGMSTELRENGPFTVFAPTNTALESRREQLSRSNSSSLQRFVRNHMLTGMALKRQISAMSKVPTLGDVILNVVVSDNGELAINNHSVVRYNLRAVNGVVHIIDAALEE